MECQAETCKRLPEKVTIQEKKMKGKTLLSHPKSGLFIEMGAISAQTVLGKEKCSVGAPHQIVEVLLHVVRLVQIERPPMERWVGSN